MNNNELHEHQRSDSFKWIIAFTLIAVLLVGMFASLFLNLKDKNDEEKPTEETTVTAQALTNDFAVNMMNNTGKIRLMASNSFVEEPSLNPAPELVDEYGVATAAAATVSKTLTATVYPATAENTLVDWSVAWGNSSNTATVTDYVTVTPSSAGSKTATVTCKKAFTGNIIVTVTTRENGYSASCIVTYLGKPTDVMLTGSLTENNGTFNMGIGQTYTFDVGLTNPFNSVGSQFNSISVSVNGVGSVILGYMEKNNSSGNENWYDSSDETVTLESLKNNFITVSYANKKLTVTTIKSIESYYESTQRLDAGRTTAYNNKFRSFVDDCYFTVTVKENTSGLSKTFKIRFDNTVVTGVSVNNTELAF